MRHLNLDQLRTLIAIVDLARFSAAAKALHLAQPTVSLHISELESRLGAQLLVRGTPRIAPTAAGAVLVERARQLLRDADDAIDAVQRQASGTAGRVRLGASTGIIVQVLPQMLKALEREYPGIDVEVNILGSRDALARLAAGTLDIGMVGLPVERRPDMVIAPWRTQNVLACVPAQWETPKRITPQWLAGVPLILNDTAAHLHRLVMEWFAAAGQAPRARIESNYDAATISLVGTGYGASLLPAVAAGGFGARVRMVPVGPALVRRLGLAHRRDAGSDATTQNVLSVFSRFTQG
mgnify:CR=1 FL=1